MGQNRLILASASPRRIKLLEQIGVKPSLIVAADINEIPQKAEKPSEFSKRMALSKALKVDSSDLLAVCAILKIKATSRLSMLSFEECKKITDYYEK